MFLDHILYILFVHIIQRIHIFSNVCVNLLNAASKGIYILVYLELVYFIKVHDGLDNSVHRPKYRGIIHAFFSIQREEGLRVLYRVSVMWKTMLM